MGKEKLEMTINCETGMQSWMGDAVYENEGAPKGDWLTSEEMITGIISKALPRDGIKSEPPQVLHADFSTPIGAVATEGAKLEWGGQTLAQKEEELRHTKIILENVNRELVETNYALSMLARNIDQRRQEVIQKMTSSIASRVLPIIDEIGHANIPKSCQILLGAVRADLINLVPDLILAPDDSVRSHVLFGLSKSEQRVAIMIRNGLKTVDIARLLCLSGLTIKTHRRNIRKKLGVTNRKINLSSLLKSKLGNSQSFSRR
jgi:DNA-binding CsgD family transcriptional regulator